MEKPICTCGCGEPMRWHKDARRPPGGYWECAVRHREANHRYFATEAGREMWLKHSRKRRGNGLTGPALTREEVGRMGGPKGSLASRNSEKWYTAVKRANRERGLRNARENIDAKRAAGSTLQPEVGNDIDAAIDLSRLGF